MNSLSIGSILLSFGMCYGIDIEQFCFSSLSDFVSRRKNVNSWSVGCLSQLRNLQESSY